MPNIETNLTPYITRLYTAVKILKHVMHYDDDDEPIAYLVELTHDE